MNRCLWLTAVLLISACACRPPSPVSQLDPTAQHLAVVAATDAPDASVRILRVQGAGCEGGPCSTLMDYHRVHPGWYTFTVRTNHFPPRQNPTGSLVVDTAVIAHRIATSYRTPIRQISFEVDAGHTYTIHYDESNSTYAIYLREGVRKRTLYRANIEPPKTAIPCVAEPQATDGEFACRLSE